MATKSRSQNRVFNFSLTNRIEQQYERDLNNVSSEVTSMVNSFTKKLNLGKEHIEIEDVGDLVEKLQEYSEKISGWAERTANKMVYSLEREDLRQWERHSKQMSILMKKELKQKDINAELKKYMDDNVHLIKSIPTRAAERVHRIVLNNLTTGKRAESVAKEIMNTGSVSKSQAALIARTETARVTTGLVKVRSESVGLGWYVWKSTRDARVRHAHKMMNNVLCQWGDEPNPEALFPKKGAKPYGDYLPGATFNCRCYPAPLIRVDDINWPAKVFRKGKITLMNKSQFMKITNQEFYKNKKAA